MKDGQPTSCHMSFLKWWGSKLDVEKQIFCNRSLNMKSIVAIGFDMDYTLAQYKPDSFESLAYKGTIMKLVHDLGYPKELLKWTFDWKYMVRGLVVDKRRGNILKMDRHKYVKVAYHGFCELSREERMSTYGITLSQESYDEPDYALIDTLFSLAEAYIFAQLVDFKDSFPERLRLILDYEQMYKDVRAAIDLCHRDGTVKHTVADDPSKYIIEDQHVLPMLQLLRDSGRMTFLVTNSLWDYTNIVMNSLCGKFGARQGLPRDYDWLKYFDIVITGSAKPGFFVDGNRAPLFEVDIHSGMLHNTDNGTPLSQVGSPGSNNISKAAPHQQACRVFQGGSVAHLHKLLEIEAGAQVLYVGDHIYGDILRSKKQLGWRTMLVVPELEKELMLLHETTEIRKEIRRLRHLREGLEDVLRRQEWKLKFDQYSGEEQENILREVQSLQAQRDKVCGLHRQMQRNYHNKFHEIWGQLMKTGYQNSRFAHQVERFACLYTSQVSNLCYYSPNKSFRTGEDFMPHELDELCL
ncbi:hypothetical protein O6H91_16G001300 [Diphasiastrum complanatum]|nr:hypothetical protein O6H91_16G001300 [Diphasiastrum complanatum]